MHPEGGGGKVAEGPSSRQIGVYDSTESCMPHRCGTRISKRADARCYADPYLAHKGVGGWVLRKRRQSITLLERAVFEKSEMAVALYVEANVPEWRSTFTKSDWYTWKVTENPSRDVGFFVRPRP